MGDLSKNLSRSEFACKCGCGFSSVDPDLVEILQAAVDHFMDQEDESVVDRVAIHINSGNRCPAHNKAVGGSARSRHVQGQAADFYLEYVMNERDNYGRTKRQKIHPDIVANYLDDKYPNEYGIGWYNGRTHFDTSKSGRRRWDLR